MMIDPPIDLLTKKTKGNRYTDTKGVYIRARQLAAGKPALVNVPEGEKPIQTALREAFEGKILIVTGDSQK